MRNGERSGAIKTRMLESALERWIELGLTKRPRLLEIFSEGKNHHAGLIDVSGEKQVIKVFRHSIEPAVDAQQQAAEFDLAPKIYARHQNSVLMEFLDGSVPEIKQMADSLSILHSKSLANRDGLDLRRYFDQYLQNSSEQLKSKHQSLLPLLEEFFNDTTPWCFCHNDLVAENCIAWKSSAYFIDWEYAAQHNPWFDLAAVMLYRGLDTEQAKEFLRRYAGWQRKVEDRIFLISQITLLWSDLLWHIDRYGYDYQVTHQKRFSQLDSLVAQLGLHT